MVSPAEPAPTELPNADLLLSKLPTRMPLDPRDHAITPRPSPKLTAPGLPPVVSHPLTTPTEPPNADLLLSKLPTRMPLDPRDHAITPRPSPKLTAPGLPPMVSHPLTA